MHLDAATLRTFTGDRRIVGVPPAQARRSRPSLALILGGHDVLRLYANGANGNRSHESPGSTCGGSCGGGCSGSCGCECGGEAHGTACGCGGGKGKRAGATDQQRRSRAAAANVPDGVATHAELACPVALLSEFDLWQCSYFCRGNVQRCWHEWSAERGTCELQWDCYTTADILAEAGVEGGPTDHGDPYYEIPTEARNRLCGLVSDYPTADPPSSGSTCEVEGLDCNPPRINAFLSARHAIPDAVLRESAAETVVLHDADPLETELILSAWAMLRLNEDLLRYALCISTGKEGSGDCVANRINRTWARVEIRVSDSEPTTESAKGGPDATGGRIKLWRGGPVLPASLEKFASDSPSVRLCGVLDLAGVLFHELMHVCRHELGFWSLGGRHDQERCDHVYKAENTFYWAVAQRYPGVLRNIVEEDPSTEFLEEQESCCAHWAHPCQFNFDASGGARC